MSSIAQVLGSFKRATEPLLNDLEIFMRPFAQVLPDQRYRYSLNQFVPGMLAARSPQVSQAAAHAPHRGVNTWPLAKRMYHLLDTPEFQHRAWLKVLYADARRVAEKSHVERIVIAYDPVNFEQPYAEKLEYLSEVWKSTPSGSLPKRESRITPGYPAIIAQTVNLEQPTIPYANWFSYTSPDFLSENVEIQRGVRTMRTVFPTQMLCLVTDSGFDDQKFFAYCGRHKVEFVTRASHDRWIDVFNERLQRWEHEHLKDVVNTVPGNLGFEISFRHAGKTARAHITLDWFQIRLPETQQVLWVVVGVSDYFPDPLVLITNRRVSQVLEAQQVYRDWLRRPSIEHLYRFIQEDGLDVEEIQVQTLERQRRTFVLVLAGALFVLRVPGVWQPATIAWLRALGSSLVGTKMDRKGPYALLLGIQNVFSTVALFSAIADGLLQAVSPPQKANSSTSSFG
jgi:hypothetical protein